MPFYVARIGPCAGLRDFQNRLPSLVLGNFGRPLVLLFVEQTPTALSVNEHRDSYSAAPNSSSNFSMSSSIMAARL